jgi:hypothetical protein
MHGFEQISPSSSVPHETTGGGGGGGGKSAATELVWTEGSNNTPIDVWALLARLATLVSPRPWTWRVMFTVPLTFCRFHTWLPSISGETQKRIFHVCLHYDKRITGA